MLLLAGAMGAAIPAVLLGQPQAPDAQPGAAAPATAPTAEGSTTQPGGNFIIIFTAADPIETVPKDDELLTAVITLRYTNATQLRQDLQPFIDPGAVFSSNASSNSLVITDVTSNIRRVFEIIKALDSNLAEASDMK